MPTNHIQQITSDGIVYQDANGATQTIAFADCYQDYLHLKLRGTHGFWRWRKAWRLRTWKEVGVRDPLAEPPVIELHANPLVRFEFETVESYRAARNAIMQAGWALFDLS